MIDRNEVCDFFDSYDSFCTELQQEREAEGEKFDDNDLYPLDNDNTLLEWYGCFDGNDNPFNTANLQLYLSDTLERIMKVIEDTAHKYDIYISRIGSTDKNPTGENQLYWIRTDEGDMDITLSKYDFKEFVQDLYCYCDIVPDEFIDELSEIAETFK